MFLQALTEYADRTLAHELDNVAFEEREVSYLIEIDDDGRFLDIVEWRASDLAVGKNGTSPRRGPLLVPRSPVNRTGGVHPLLAADDIKYVLGPGAWTDARDRTNHEERFAAFVALVRCAASETKDATLVACRSFYADPAAVEQARHQLSGAKAGSTVALSVNGPVILRDTVREYWRVHYERAARERTARGPKRECLISGRCGPVERTHPKVRHTTGIGGQPSGVSLISFDKGAFRSYGWDQCTNSPISADRVMAYVLALNDLLKPGSRHRHDFGDVAFICWTSRAEEFDPLLVLTEPSPEHLHHFFEISRGADLASDRFYMAALSTSGGRLVLRSWFTETLLTVRENIRQWLVDMEVQPLMAGTPVTAPSLWQVLHAVGREGKSPANGRVALLRRALEGPKKQPLGIQMLNTVLSRIRVDRSKRLNPAAIGLVRLCMNDVSYRSMQNGDVLMNVGLDEGNMHPAYLCGRLLAIYESLQYATFSAAGVSRVNVTVADRYYVLASTSPLAAFPRVVELGRKHLQKLRRSKGGLARVIEADIATLRKEIENPNWFAYPAQLSLDGRGRFAMGYYHQRAKQFQQRQLIVMRASAPAESEERKER